MKFIGLFAACFLLIIIGISVFAFLFQNIWGLIALAAFLMALVVRMYLDLDQRLERIEQHLGLTDKDSEKTFTEQMKENNENAP